MFQKVLLLGDERTGKSSIASRLCKQGFSDAYIPTTAPIFQNFSSNENTIPLQVVDTAGAVRYSAITTDAIQNVFAIGFVLDGTDSPYDQCIRLRYWLMGANQKAPDAQLFVFINKSDLETFNGTPENWETTIQNELSDEEKSRLVCIACCSAKEDTPSIAQTFQKVANKLQEVLPCKGSPRRPIHAEPKEEISFMQKSWACIKNNKIWTGGDLLLVLAIITFLVLSAFEEGKFLTLGLEQKGAAQIIPASIGVASLFFWNLGCYILTALTKRFSNEALPVNEEDVEQEYKAARASRNKPDPLFPRYTATHQTSSISPQVSRTYLKT